MTREEAIQILSTRDAHGVLCGYTSGVTEALDMAIEALHREEAEEKGWCHRIRPKNVEVVVRCKDCKHWYADADTGMACEFTNMGQPEDGYCNWGERKGGDDNGNG